MDKKSRLKRAIRNSICVDVAFNRRYGLKPRRGHHTTDKEFFREKVMQCMNSDCLENRRNMVIKQRHSFYRCLTCKCHFDPDTGAMWFPPEKGEKQ